MGLIWCARQFLPGGLPGGQRPLRSKPPAEFRPQALCLRGPHRCGPWPPNSFSRLRRASRSPRGCGSYFTARIDKALTDRPRNLLQTLRSAKLDIGSLSGSESAFSSTLYTLLGLIAAHRYTEQDSPPKFHVGEFSFRHISSIVGSIGHASGSSAHRFTVAVYHSRVSGSFLGLNL